MVCIFCDVYAPTKSAAAANPYTLYSITKISQQMIESLMRIMFHFLDLFGFGSMTINYMLALAQQSRIDQLDDIIKTPFLGYMVVSMPRSVLRICNC